MSVPLGVWLSWQTSVSNADMVHVVRFDDPRGIDA